MIEQELQEIENTTDRIREDVDDWRDDVATVRLVEVRATCDAIKTLIAEVRRLRERICPTSRDCAVCRCEMENHVSQYAMFKEAVREGRDYNHILPHETGNDPDKEATDDN